MTKNELKNDLQQIHNKLDGSLPLLRRLQGENRFTDNEKKSLKNLENTLTSVNDMVDMFLERVENMSEIDKFREFGK